MSLYADSTNAHAAIFGAFKSVMEAQLAALSSINQNNMVLAHALAMMAQAASAPRVVHQNQQGEPVVVDVLTNQ